MASGYLPKPGTPHGPCEGECQHKDCAATRRMAASKCTICRKRIGYEVAFFRDAPDSLQHAKCVWDEAERKSN